MEGLLKVTLIFLKNFSEYKTVLAFQSGDFFAQYSGTWRASLLIIQIYLCQMATANSIDCMVHIARNQRKYYSISVRRFFYQKKDSFLFSLRILCSKCWVRNRPNKCSKITKAIQRQRSTDRTNLGMIRIVLTVYRQSLPYQLKKKTSK